MATKWSHGYNTEVPYTFGFYRETTPEWIDFSALISGFMPPKVEDRPMRMMDLGCGQGFGLCAIAALHPNMEFLGVDFNPAHIAHAEELARRAGLSNVKFVEGDFVELGQNWPEELGLFDCIVLHGVWSWIGPVARAGAIGVIRQALRPGGLVYNSYNAQPGWHAGAILRELLSMVVTASSGDSQLEALRKGVMLANRLKELGATVFKAYPGLTGRVEMLAKHDLHYVANEYVNEAHYIYWGHEVADEMAEAKLTFIGSATLPENFLPALLPQQMAELVNQYTHPRMKNLIIDLAINQAFRRDIFQRGAIRATRLPQIVRLNEVKLIGMRSGKKDFKFSLSIGEVNGREEMYGPLQEICDEGPITFGELLVRHPAKPNIAQLVQAVSIALWDSRIAFASYGGDVHRTARGFNEAVLSYAREGRFYAWLAAPATNQAINASVMEMLVLAAILIDGLQPDPEVIAQRVLQDMNNLGLNVTRDEKVLEGSARADEVRRQVAEICEKRLPVFSHLGII